MSTITLPNIRVSSDLTVRVRLKDGGVAIDWSTLTGVKAYLYADEQRSIASRCAVSVDEEDSTLLVCQYAASKPQYLGVNRIIVCATYMGETKNYDKPALNFVRWTADQEGEQITIDDPDVDVEIEVNDVSSSILQEAIDAALQAAADAEEAAHLVPLQVLQDCVTATGQAQDATTAANAAADAANAAGITQVEASVDSNVGTPSVDVDLTNKKLTLGFHNMKGIQGETGATPDISIGEVTTGAAGSQAAATMTGTAVAPVLNLTIPKGDKGDQGNSGYQGAAGELEVVNNLTDGGSTAALSAEMGKTLKGEVSQLEAKVTDLDDEISGYDWENFQYTRISSGAIVASGSYAGTVVYSSNVDYTDYCPVTPGERIKIPVFRSASSSSTAGCAFYNSEKVYVTGYAYPGADEAYDEVKEYIVPEGCYFFRTSIIKADSSPVFQRFALGESYKERIVKLEEEVNEMGSSLSQLDTLKMQIQRNDDLSIIEVDLMRLCHSVNLINNHRVMEVVTATEDSLTLSSEDAEDFSLSTVAVVEFSDGRYLPVFFAERTSGDTITRAAFDTTDLSTALRIQSIHDTSRGGLGQHLSPFGYLAMGQFVAAELKKKTSQKDKNWLGGMVAQWCESGRGYQNTEENNKVYDLDGNVICTPVFSSNWKWGGYTSNGNGLANGRGITRKGTLYNANNGWSGAAYSIEQGNAGAFVELPFTVSGKGFVEIAAGLCPSKVTSTGGCTMSLYVDGELAQSWSLVANMSVYRVENLTVTKGISVRLSLDSQADTEACIYSIGFWQMYDQIPLASVDSITKVAVVGDSWTEFPTSNAALPDFKYNTPITRPDGTIDYGYGYFPKELASSLGVDVDIWSYGGNRLDQSAFEHINEAISKDYDYIVLCHFVNDLNSSEGFDTYLTYLKQYAKKCRQHGVRLVYLMPCFTNGTSQGTSLGAWHDKLLPGLGSI